MHAVYAFILVAVVGLSTAAQIPDIESWALPTYRSTPAPSTALSFYFPLTDDAPSSLYASFVGTTEVASPTYEGQVSFGPGTTVGLATPNPSNGDLVGANVYAIDNCAVYGEHTACPSLPQQATPAPEVTNYWLYTTYDGGDEWRYQAVVTGTTYGLTARCVGDVLGVSSTCIAGAQATPSGVGILEDIGQRVEMRIVGESGAEVGSKADLSKALLVFLVSMVVFL